MPTGSDLPLMAEFPTRERLWKGALLHTICHALWIVEVPSFRFYLDWQDGTYLSDNGEGDRAAITFRESACVAVFFDHESKRSPYGYPTPAGYTHRKYFQGAPAEIIELVEANALQYMLDDLDGKTVPVITTAFWSEGDRLTAAEPWDDIWKSASQFFRIELAETLEIAAELIEENWEFSAAHIETVFAIYRHALNPMGSLDAAVTQQFTSEGLALMREAGIPL